MKPAIALTLLLVACQATHAPFEQQMFEAHTHVSYIPEDIDTWTLGCPSHGDCEDIALCMLDRMGNVKQDALLVVHIRDGVQHAVVHHNEWTYDPTYNESYKGLPGAIIRTFTYEQALQMVEMKNNANQ